MLQKIMNIAICCAVLIWGFHPIESSRPVENTPLYTHGILYEKLKNVKFQLGEWMFHSSQNLDILTKEIRVVEILSNYINESCSKLDTDFGIDCLQILAEINYEVKNLDDIKEIIDAQCKTVTSSRTKRQINFIGHIFKEIAGVMDSDDSKRVDNDLIKIKNNEQQLMGQLHKQTIAIDSMFELTNQTIYNVQDKLLNFSLAIDSINKQKSEEGAKYLARNHLNTLIGELNLILTHVIRRKDLITQLMQTGDINLTPELVTPTLFLSELEKASKQLPSGYRFPVQPNLKNIMMFYKLSKTTSILNDCEINVNIITPIVSNILFEAHKGTTVPIIKDNKILIVPLENDVILKSHNNSVSTTMKYSEYDSCMSVQDFKLCQTTHKFHNGNITGDCLSEMFLNKTSNSCIYQPLTLNHQLWLQTADKNMWVYAVPNSTTINILQNGKLSHTELSGVGKLRITEPCLIYFNTIYLHYYTKGSTDFEFEIQKIDFPHIQQETSIIKEKIPNTIKHNVIPIINEKSLFDEINNLKAMNSGKIQLMDIELEKHSISFWKIFLVLISISIISWLIIKLYKFLKTKFAKGNNNMTSRRQRSPPHPSAPFQQSEPLRIIYSTNNEEENEGVLFLNNKRLPIAKKQMLGQISF
ncbi:uncharacterized protein LOC134207910 [Armigeres subalbatus]|uniref:uncharacterized protein LOC134207910 n=1 Tax=Armigeres subalbatus TaxID=124917 RepID=UPI002ED2D7D2